MNDSPHVGQPDARPFEFIGAVEALEDAKELVDIRHVESDAVVAHVHHGVVRLAFTEVDFDDRMGLVRAVLRRI